MAASGKPETTIALRVYHVRRVLGDVDVGHLVVTTEQLVDYLGTRSWKPDTRKSYRSSLRSFFGWVQATGRRQDNPADLIPTVKVPRGVPRPTPEHIYRAALEAAEPRVRIMIMLAAMCGLRRGEISRAHSDALVQDLDGWSLRVLGKGGHERMVPLPALLAEILRNRPAGWLFPSPCGGHLTPGHVGVLVARALPAGWSCHTLRHRCATVAYATRRDLRAVQELLGHAKPETTMLYTLIPRADIRAAMEAAAA